MNYTTNYDTANNEMENDFGNGNLIVVDFNQNIATKFYRGKVKKCFSIDAMSLEKYGQMLTNFEIALTRLNAIKAINDNKNEIEYEIKSPDKRFIMKLGEIKNGSINIITNFNPIVQSRFIFFLNGDRNVEKVTSLSSYDEQMGGISIKLSDVFSYNNLIPALQAISQVFLK